MFRRTFYKATRPDGTDFQTGKIEHRVGSTIYPNMKDAIMHREGLCGPGWLHACSKPESILLYIQTWPIRLFEVKGTPKIGFSKSDSDKGGFESLQIVRELPYWLVFGPSGRECDWIINTYRALSVEEILLLETCIVNHVNQLTYEQSVRIGIKYSRVLENAFFGYIRNPLVDDHFPSFQHPSEWIWKIIRLLILKKKVEQETLSHYFAPWRDFLEKTGRLQTQAA